MFLDPGSRYYKQDDWDPRAIVLGGYCGDALMLAEPMGKAARRRWSMKTPIGPLVLGMSLATAWPHNGPENRSAADATPTFLLAVSSVKSGLQS